MDLVTPYDYLAQCIGIGENPQGSNRTMFGEWYGMNGQPWCSIAVSWAYFMSGWLLFNPDDTKRWVAYGNTPQGFHSVPNAYKYFHDTGALTMIPARGDLVFYSWDGKSIDHVGIFGQKTLNEVIACEGNTRNNIVEIMTRKEKLVKGYAKCFRHLM